jgi:hypothetical protein
MVSSGEYPPSHEFASLGDGGSQHEGKATVAEAPINMECRVVQILPVGNGPHTWCWAKSCGLYPYDPYNPTRSHRHVQPAPVGRLAGELYTHCTISSR